MRVGVILPNWVGDVVMATPTLRALRERFPRPDRLVGVLRPYVRGVLSGSDWFDETIEFDRRKQGHWNAWRNVRRRLRDAQLDLIVAMPNSLSSGIVAWLSGARQRIGYAGRGRTLLLTSALNPNFTHDDGTPTSLTERFLDLTAPAGCTTLDPRVELHTSPDDERGADEYWTRSGLQQPESVIALNPGSTFGSARNWAPERFAELSRRLVDGTGRDVLVICGPAEKDVARAIAAEAGHPRVKSMADDVVSLGVLKAVLRRVRLLVTGDSGPRHLAAGFQTPTLVIAGPIDPRKTGNHNPHEAAVFQPMDCLPCGKHDCPLGHRHCMTQLTVDRVLAATHAHLDRTAARRRLDHAA